MGPSWFVLWTAPQREAKIEKELRDENLVSDSFLPKEKILRLKPERQRRKGEPHREPVERVLFPRYLFVAVHDVRGQDWDKVRGVYGVLDILSDAADRPLALPASAIEKMREDVAAGRYDATVQEAARLAEMVGRIVEIKKGPFAGLLAKVTQATKKGVTAELEMLGAVRPVKMSIRDAKDGGG